MLRQESRRRAVVRIATMLSALTVATLSAVAPAGAANRGSDDTRKVRAISSPATLPAWLHKLPPRQYTTFDGAHTFSLTPWQGRHVAVMVPDTRSTPVMIKIVQALDSAWSYYRSTTGRAPSPYRTINGRIPIAVVPDGETCGAGCSWLGATGTEIERTYFDVLYDAVRQHGQYDQVLFYEMGRNFWFYGNQLTASDNSNYGDAVTTGFAVLMRFRSMAAAGVPGAPFNGTPFPTFQANVANLIKVYEADPSKTFAATLGSDASPGDYGGTDFFASIMMRLAARHGGQGFLSRFWHGALAEPVAGSTTSAVTNLVAAASKAACVDLSSVFYDRWGFPRPNGTITPRPPANTVPEPVGRC